MQDVQKMHKQNLILTKNIITIIHLYANSYIIITNHEEQIS